MRRNRSPWTYLEEMVHYDRGPEHNEQWMTEKLQEQFPGPYKVEAQSVFKHYGVAIKYAIVFDDPKEEMLARIKWS